jgi:integrative and conjugative element protein (TIGR02256 family)
MKYRRPNEGVVELSEPAATVISRQRQLNSTASEAGGMLLGRLINGSDDVIIDEVTEPASSDRRGRLFFMRSKKHAQQHVNSAWEESERTRNYLGEWHTHPEDDPVPSTQDLYNWRRIATVAQYEQDYLFFIIVGRNKTRIWELHKVRGTLAELPLLS